MIPNAVYSLPVRTQVTCPECGSGGANSGPCYCHVCRVMMLPSMNGRIVSNWGEYLRTLTPRRK